MQLDEFFKYKETLMGEMLTNEEIVKLINPEVSIEDAKSLVYTQVFPCEYVPPTVQDGKTYICCDVDIDESYNKTYLAPLLFIWVFTHRNNLRLPDGGVRTDKVCSEICKQINGSRYFGLGEMNLSYVKRFAPMTDYQGKVMCFRLKEFNRLYDGKKDTPANRRNGV